MKDAPFNIESMQFMSLSTLVSRHFPTLFPGRVGYALARR